MMNWPFNPDQNDLHWNDSIIESENLDTHGELLFDTDLGAEVLLCRLLFDQCDDFLQVLEVDADGEDVCLEILRDKVSKLDIQCFFLVDRVLLLDEATCQRVFHVG